MTPEPGREAGHCLGQLTSSQSLFNSHPDRFQGIGFFNELAGSQS